VGVCLDVNKIKKNSQTVRRGGSLSGIVRKAKKWGSLVRPRTVWFLRKVRECNGDILVETDRNR
jgi:hypothetical protein